MNLANDCEHGWYYLNGTCIVFSNGGTIPNLSLNSCENVQLQIDCPTPVFNCNIYFTDVKKSTTTESQSNNTEGLSALKIVLIVIGILVALSIII
ncbi:uncharacterized protein [Misgurnus anguillicaudatus]|uniref:uncharacterized protein n=1 Tax=Misgurnus anguillicaudatus TaxID=75329 RepID=UPI003CCFAAF0